MAKTAKAGPNCTCSRQSHVRSVTQRSLDSLALLADQQTHARPLTCARYPFRYAYMRACKKHHTTCCWCIVYLVAYNLAAMCGWAYVIAIVVQCALESATPAQLWARVAVPLQVAQTMAILEIVHAASGLVRSPVATTFLQVFSRDRKSVV